MKICETCWNRKKGMYCYHCRSLTENEKYKNFRYITEVLRSDLNKIKKDPRTFHETPEETKRYVSMARKLIIYLRILKGRDPLY